MARDTEKRTVPNCGLLLLTPLSIDGSRSDTPPLLLGKSRLARFGLDDNFDCAGDINAGVTGLTFNLPVGVSHLPYSVTLPDNRCHGYADGHRMGIHFQPRVVDYTTTCPPHQLGCTSGVPKAARHRINRLAVPSANWDASPEAADNPNK